MTSRRRAKKNDAHGLAFLVFVVYKELPQELGGVRARCASLDVDTTKMTQEALEAFAVPKSNGLTRIEEVEIMYSRGDRLIARQTNGSRVYEFRGDVVKGLEGC